MLDKLLEADVQKSQLIQKNIDDKKIDFEDTNNPDPFQHCEDTNNPDPNFEEKPFEERFPMIEHQEDSFPPDIPFEERFPMIEQEDKLK